MEKLEALLEWGGVKKDVICLVLGGVSLLVSIFGLAPGLPFDPAWVAIILCGVPIILEAVIGLVTAFDIKADVLVSMALIASVIIGEDFADPVTVEVLDSERRIDIGLHPEIARELAERQRQEEELLRPLENPMPQEDILHGTDAAVDGRDLPLLDERKGWYREEMYGREVEVGQIGVHPAQAEGKYVMTAVIDGRVVSHEITQRDYDRFLAVDDYHRMKLFSKIFSEVEMKPRPETQRGLGVKIFAALTAGAVVTAGVAHGLHHHRHAPEIYGGHYGGPPRPYFKPGVDTPRDVAIRAFEAEMNREADDMRRGR